MSFHGQQSSPGQQPSSQEQASSVQEQPSSFQEQLRLVLADRNSPEARNLFLRLLQYVDGRVTAVWRGSCHDLLGSGEREDVVGTVMEQLIGDGLARFRGGSLGELLGFVRVVTDRCLIHHARRRLRERRVLAEEGPGRIDWNARFARPDEGILEIPDNPLPATDQTYLLELLKSGSMAEHARRQNVSRAAVTLRVQRIRSRIEALSQREQGEVEAWLEHAAHQAALVR